MASMIDAFNDAFSDKLAAVKLPLYGALLYFGGFSFIIGIVTSGGDIWAGIAAYMIWLALLGLIFLGLITQGIYNIRHNRKDVLTLNVLELMFAVLKTALVIVPWAIITSLIAQMTINFILSIVTLPVAGKLVPTIIWSIQGLICFTAYLSFAKNLSIKQGYNIKAIIESIADVFLHIIFFAIQAAIIDLILIGFIGYVLFCFNISLATCMIFHYYCCVIFVANISMFANFFAQASYEIIRGDSKDYDDKSTMNYLEEVEEESDKLHH